MEVRVRGEMSQIHHEIYELRKFVESCIASQVKMQHSIKEEVCSALREAGELCHIFFKFVFSICNKEKNNTLLKQPSFHIESRNRSYLFAKRKKCII